MSNPLQPPGLTPGEPATATLPPYRAVRGACSSGGLCPLGGSCGPAQHQAPCGVRWATRDNSTRPEAARARRPTMGVGARPPAFHARSDDHDRPLNTVREADGRARRWDGVQARIGQADSQAAAPPLGWSRFGWSRSERPVKAWSPPGGSSTAPRPRAGPRSPDRPRSGSSSSSAALATGRTDHTQFADPDALHERIRTIDVVLFKVMVDRSRGAPPSTRPQSKRATSPSASPRGWISRRLPRRVTRPGPRRPAALQRQPRRAADSDAHHRASTPQPQRPGPRPPEGREQQPPRVARVPAGAPNITPAGDAPGGHHIPRTPRRARPQRWGTSGPTRAHADSLRALTGEQERCPAGPASADPGQQGSLLTPQARRLGSSRPGP